MGEGGSYITVAIYTSSVQLAFSSSPGSFLGFVAFAIACVLARLSTITATNRLWCGVCVCVCVCVCVLEVYRTNLMKMKVSKMVKSIRYTRICPCSGERERERERYLLVMHGDNGGVRGMVSRKRRG